MPRIILPVFMASIASIPTSIEDIMTHICSLIIPIIEENALITGKDLSHAVLDALCEAKVVLSLPQVSEKRTFTEKQKLSQAHFRDSTKKNGHNWAIIKTIPDELAFWKSVATKVPKKTGSKLELSAWQVFQMFNGNKESVPVPVAGIIARPSKK